jgi:histidine triad (HIT) family protein
MAVPGERSVSKYTLRSSARPGDGRILLQQKGYCEMSSNEQAKQELYRDARFKNHYDSIWQSVNKCVCVFCELNEKYVFFEENGVVMTISLFAYIDGHFMIVPRRHIKSAKDLTQQEWETIRKFAYIAKKLIKDVHKVRGMQVVQKDGAAAQSTVEHIHFHCIPFDTPDLCQWNYRQLKYTPLENVNLYKQQRKKIIKHNLKFEAKYKNPSGLRIICDLVIINTSQEVLLQERTEDNKLAPDYLTLPGGGVDNYDATLENELAREIQEETGIVLNTDTIELVHSSISSVNYSRKDKSLNVRYTSPSRFLWNVYLLKNFDPKTVLKPGDDCKELVWISLRDARKHPRLSSGIKEVLENIKL